MQEPQLNETPNGKSWLNIIAALFVATSIGIAAYMTWKIYDLKTTENQLKIAIETQKENLAELREREQIGSKMKAVEILRKARNYRKNWSEVLTDLNNAFTSQGRIKFNSVAVDADNAVEIRAQAPDFLTAASFLVLVKRSDKFDNAFISTIAPKGGREEAGVSYNFSASFDYLGTPATKEN